MDPELAAAGELCRLRALVQSIKDALNTEEDWEALVEVARDAHRAERRLAGMDRSPNTIQCEVTVQDGVSTRSDYLPGTCLAGFVLIGTLAMLILDRTWATWVATGVASSIFLGLATLTWLAPRDR